MLISIVHVHFFFVNTFQSSRNRTNSCNGIEHLIYIVEITYARETIVSYNKAVPCISI